MEKITYPTLYMDLENPFMAEAKKIALEQPKSKQPYLVGSVVVKKNRIIGKGNNFNPYHQTQGCEKRKQNLPNIGNYDVCPGCDTNTHSEPRALQDAKENGHDTTGADVYMYGHYRACDQCTDAMLDAGIAHLYVVTGAQELFTLKP